MNMISCDIAVIFLGLGLMLVGERKKPEIGLAGMILCVAAGLHIVAF